MPQSIKKGYKALLAEADAVVPALSIDEARALQGQEGTVFVDLRDPREIEREGKMPHGWELRLTGWLARFRVDIWL
jgi:hypothetical protein